MAQSGGTAIDTLYSSRSALIDFLIEKRETSLQIIADENLRKTLLMSIASYFEVELTRVVREFADEVAGKGHVITFIIQNKAISRQYHTWFDWNAQNVNKFLRLFGEEFQQYATHAISQDRSLEKATRDFISLGESRNRLVHRDFANFTLNQTSEDLYGSYRSAIKFIRWFPKVIREFSQGQVS